VKSWSLLWWIVLLSSVDNISMLFIFEFSAFKLVLNLVVIVVASYWMQFNWRNA